MTKASNIWTSVYGTLAKDFTDKVNCSIYYFVRAKGNTDSFVVDLETLCNKDEDLKKFVEENSVPSCKIKFFMEDECRYSFTIDNIPYREFDFEVSDEIANKHVDDYEISKDEMYDMYNNADYYDGDDYSESLGDFDE